MSVFTASGALTPAEADAYRAALLQLLGTQDPLQVLRETPGMLRAGLERVSADKRGVPEAPGKWSTRIVLAHLADSELVAAVRTRMILSVDRPPLSALDQDRWAERLQYSKADPLEALERFSVLRKANLAIWSTATPADLARVGLHDERGEESLDVMRRLYAGHDLAHLRQLSRIRIVVMGQ